MSHISPCIECVSAKQSAENIELIFNNEWQNCQHCAHQETIRRVAQRYRMLLAQWWSVSGSHVLPRWMIERLFHSIR